METFLDRRHDGSRGYIEAAIYDPDFRTPLLRKAMKFAAKAHGEQVRKYTGEPYITHPIQVARLVSMIGGDENMVAAALLHDVVEDTSVTPTEILEEFGSDIEALVWWLTDPEVKGNRAIRKEAARQHLAIACARAKTIKLADLIDNTSSIVQHDPGFAKVYLKEKNALLEVLKEGDFRLWLQAATQVEEGCNHQRQA